MSFPATEILSGAKAAAKVSLKTSAGASSLFCDDLSVINRTGARLRV